VYVLKADSQMPTPIQELPPDYQEIRHVVLTEPKLLLWLNILALVPLLAMVIVMGWWWVLIARGLSPGGTVDVPWWIAVIAILLVVLPLHELLHGITIGAIGHRVRYGAKLSKGVLYATAENALFRRDEYLGVALAPLVAITLGAMALMVVVPQWLSYYVAIGAVLNAGGAIGDLWSVGILLRYPASVLVRDEADGFRIYAAGSSIQNSAPPSAV
jgi:hypothetical protein